MALHPTPANPDGQTSLPADFQSSLEEIDALFGPVADTLDWAQLEPLDTPGADSASTAGAGANPPSPA